MLPCWAGGLTPNRFMLPCRRSNPTLYPRASQRFSRRCRAEAKEVQKNAYDRSRRKAWDFYLSGKGAGTPARSGYELPVIF
jgi:hypothetical protein